MGLHSGIAWTNGSRNLWIGCRKVSPACDHCYAERESKAYGRAGGWKGGEYFVCNNWRKDLEQWNRQARAAGEKRRIFVNQHSDILDHFGPAAVRNEFFEVAPQLDSLVFLLLTKRSENYHVPDIFPWAGQPVPPNIWCGVTAETQAYADRRLADLAKVQAQRRFVSIEPQLGRVDLRRWMFRLTCGHTDLMACDETCSFERVLHWVIAGGESGPAARPSHPAWFRFLREQCLDTETPFFFKQWGEWAPCTVPSLDADVMINPAGIVRCFNGSTLGSLPPDFARMTRLGVKNTGHLLEEHEWFQIPEVN